MVFGMESAHLWPGVLLVNYLFTYPYFNFNFTLAGYPITILCMLVVSTATSMLTTQNKRQEQIQNRGGKGKDPQQPSEGGIA